MIEPCYDCFSDGLCALRRLVFWSPSFRCGHRQAKLYTGRTIGLLPSRKGSCLEIDNLNFFRNNEYAGRMIKGYTLPGFWAQTKAVYHPLRTVRLEAGFHAFVYHGAYKYPATAYQDIARWKGDQYQTGIRLLPWFRAQAMLFEQVTVVLGNIYGAANHRLPELLYNPELNLTADLRRDCNCFSTPVLLMRMYG